MKRETALRWSWTNVLNTKRKEMLLEKFGDLEKAFAAISPEMLKALGLREDTIFLVLNRLEAFDPNAYEQELQKRDLTFLSIDDEEYPDVLRNIPDAPVFLYARGDLSILHSPLLALVGTRDMSDYGKRIVEHFVPDIVKANVVTVSGLALGVDAEVAKETIRAGGKTVAVLGHGLGQIYPKPNAVLADQIVKNGGLLLSEFPLDAQPDKYTFPARNRIIAGLSLGTIVIEAAQGSGSLITAALALEYGRDVFATCGSIFDPLFAGCHEIISKGTAKLVSDPQSVLAEIGIRAFAQSQQSSLFVAESDDEQLVWASLSSMPIPLDDIVVKSKLNAAMANAVLTMLELRGAVKNVGGGQWVRG
jgi:DNA processing protein